MLVCACIMPCLLLQSVEDIWCYLQKCVSALAAVVVASYCAHIKIQFSMNSQWLMIYSKHDTMLLCSMHFVCLKRPLIIDMYKTLKFATACCCTLQWFVGIHAHGAIQANCTYGTTASASALTPEFALSSTSLRPNEVSCMISLAELLACVP